jgi:Flp pilus assembly pilin Flp
MERAVNLRRRLSAAFSSEAGQGLAEYALILALIAIVAILALLFLGSQISDILSNTGTSI